MAGHRLGLFVGCSSESTDEEGGVVKPWRQGGRPGDCCGLQVNHSSQELGVAGGMKSNKKIWVQ